MKEEISAAAMFLTGLVSKSKGLDQHQLETFQSCLSTLLIEKFQDHWFPEKPFKGQAYRCIRINAMGRRDPVLEKAAQSCGLRYEDLGLPVELTIWVDPNEVCCRFGEHKGSCCTVASFKDGNKENFVDNLNIEVEQTAIKVPLEVNAKKDISEHSTSRKRNESAGNATSQKKVHHALPKLSSPLSGYRRGPHLHNFHNMALSQGPLPNSFPVHTHNSGSSQYSRHPSRHARNYYQAAAAYNSSQYQRNLFGSHFNTTRNDRYHWVNRMIGKA